jgi:ABC-type nitrate/sulfonate/bicarbonate transport system, permease component
MEEKQPGLPYRIYQKTIVIAILLLLWLIIPNFVHNMYLPSLVDILNAYAGMIQTGELFQHIGSSLFRAFIGLVIAEIIAIPGGVLLGWFPKAEKYFDPLLQIIRNTAVLSILPLFVLTLGIGETSKIAIVIWGTFFPSLLNTFEGVKNVDPLLIRSARSMGISNFGLLRKVVIPGALPFILTGLRLSAGVSLLVLVGAEMLGADHGLGYMIFYYEQAFLIPKMYVGILTLMIIGVLVNFLLVLLERRLTRWQEKSVV